MTDSIFSIFKKSRHVSYSKGGDAIIGWISANLAQVVGDLVSAGHAIADVKVF